MSSCNSIVKRCGTHLIIKFKRCGSHMNYFGNPNNHRPQFKASVFVNGIPFDSASATASSKKALNQAAEVAFLHLTSQESDQRSEVDKKIDGGEEVESSQFSNKSGQHSLQDGFKNKLMMYAQRKGLKQPSYDTEKEGQFFKARVSVGEDCFTTPEEELCPTANEAENSAAATALLSLLTDEFHEDDPSSFKILLKKLTDDEGYGSPIYRTMRCNKSVFCIVEVEGEVFEGEAADTVKLAELNAAKSAYTALIELKLFRPCDEIGRRLDSIVISDPKETPTEHVAQEQNTMGEKTETVEDMNKPAEMGNCYLMCNKIRVFTRMPNVPLPDHMVVMPIGENKWVIVELQFPNEKGG